MVQFSSISFRRAQTFTEWQKMVKHFHNPLKISAPIKNNCPLFTTGNTLLHDAMTKCDSEFLLSFIDEYITRDHINVVNRNGETTLYLAALAGKLEVVKKLLTLGTILKILPYSFSSHI